MYDISDQSITVVLSNGSVGMKAQGYIVTTPKLFAASVTGRVNLPIEGPMNRFCLQKLLIWAWGKNGEVVIVRADKYLVEKGLTHMRTRQGYGPRRKAAILPSDITNEVWVAMGQMIRTILFQDKARQAWCDENASLEGHGAPWAEVPPLGMRSIKAICEALSETDLHDKFFDDGNIECINGFGTIFYAKPTPCIADGEVWPTRTWPDVDTSTLSEYDRKETELTHQYFNAGFMVISFDQVHYYQATQEEIDDDLRTTGIADKIHKILGKSSFPRGTWQRVVNEKVRRLEATVAKKGKAASSSSKLTAKFSEMIGSIPVFDAADEDHLPSEYKENFAIFRKFTATTNDDIDEMLKGPKGKGMTALFPEVPYFQKPVPSAPGIKSVRKLYNLGLMVGWSGTQMFHASLPMIALAVRQCNFPNETGESFLREAKEYIQQDHEGAETEKDERVA